MVQISAPKQGATNLAGVSVDQSAIQQQALTTVLNNDIAGPVQTVAANLFNTRRAASLTPLMGILTNATRDYQTQLTTAAEIITQQLRAALQNSNAAALSNSSANQTQLNALNWTGAGAYYLESERVNDFETQRFGI